MGVSIPGYRLQSPHDLPELRKHLGGTGGRKKIRNHSDHLTLTSLIDVFSVVILFLIQSFSATGEIFLVNPALKLPEAYYGKQLERAPIVTVTPEKVTVEGLRVGDNSNIENKVEDADWNLVLLSQKLDEYKKFFEGIHPGVKFPGEVILQADRKLNFVYLKRVMFTLTKMGFTGINLAVRGEAKIAPVPQPGNVASPEEAAPIAQPKIENPSS